ncbi:MAG: hypothetical protein H3C59_13885 [Burkholderiaceae bacterium]|nr:hypothetical protein [Burkholderiaceae bacterium]
MTLTILCAGALAPPGAQRAALEADPAGASPSALAATQLRDRMRDASAAGLAPLPAASTFERRLRRARIVARERNDDAAPAELPDERWLRERFSLAGALAACVLPRSESGDEAPLVVRPVHLHLGLDHLVLAPPARATLDDAGARALAAAPNRGLAEDALELVPARADAWRLAAHDDRARATLEAFAALRAPSACVASGRNVSAWQPQGEAASRWRAFENLVQMAWFEHPLNEARARAGRLPLSGLWLEGRAGAAAARPFESVRTDDPAVAGLAQRAAARVEAFDAGALPARNALADAGFWKEALAEGDVDGWNEAWLAFDRWFEQRAKDVSPIRVVLTGERECVEIVFANGDRFRPWRRLAREALLERAR